jgi:hypothetical protein
LIFVFESLKPNNQELIFAKFSEKETEEIIVSGRIISVSEDENRVKFKFEVCSITDGILFKDKIKNYSINSKKNITMSGRFNRENFIVTSIK